MKLVGNGTVITMDPGNPVITGGGVVIDGTKIVAVGAETQLRPCYPQAEFIDARAGVIMPGMINTHMHFYSAFARGMALPGFAPQDFVQILEGLWWKLDKVLTPEDNYLSALVSGIEAIQNGTTTLVDHHASPNAIDGSLDKIAQAMTELGLRAGLSYEVSDRDGEDVALAGIAENVRFGDWCRRTQPQLLAPSFGLHASFTLSDATLKKCAEAGADMGFHVHTAEAASDREYNLKHHGLPVVKRLDKFGLWKPTSLAIHCVHIDTEEMELLAARNVNVVHNPESNMGNAVGRADVLAMLARGLRVGLGTDGYTTDMFEGLKVANLVHKHDTGDPTAAGAQVPQMAFANNTEIARHIFDQSLGRLQAGWQADLIVLDYKPYTPLTGDNYYSHILMGMSGGMVNSTIVAGQVLMHNREILTVDKEKVYAQANRQASQTWQRV